MCAVTIMCNQFKITADISDIDKWNERLKYVEHLQKKYGFDFCIRELFYELLQYGACITFSKTRAEVVKNILKSEGYEVKSF